MIHFSFCSSQSYIILYYIILYLMLYYIISFSKNHDSIDLCKKLSNLVKLIIQIKNYQLFSQSL